MRRQCLERGKKSAITKIRNCLRGEGGAKRAVLKGKRECEKRVRGSVRSGAMGKGKGKGGGWVMKRNG